MEQENSIRLGVKWSDEWPSYRIVVEMYTDGTQKEVWKGTIAMGEDQIAAYEEYSRYLKEREDGTTK